MRKVWKKAVSMTLTLAMLVGLMSCLTIQAGAASGAEVTNVSKDSSVTALKLQDAEGNVVSEGVEKLALTVAVPSDGQYVVFLLNGTSSYPTLPDKDNIRYIDQAESGGKSLSMNVYPDKLISGKYALYISGTGTGLKQLATFEVEAGLLGDVTGEGIVNMSDWIILRQHLLGNLTGTDDALSDQQLAQADVTGDGVLNMTDWIVLRQHLLGNINIHE